MATIVNDRDVLLQAASPRIMPTTLPGNVTVPPGQLGNGQLPGGVTVPPGNLGSGALPDSISVPALSVTGTLQTYQLSAAVVTTANLSAQNISANQIVSGTISTSRLASDVITAGNLSAQNIYATQVVAGSFAGKTFTGGTFSGVSIIGSATIQIPNCVEFYQNRAAFDVGLFCNMGAIFVGQAGQPNTSTEGANGILMIAGYNFQSAGYVTMTGRAQNNKATLTVEAVPGTSDAHAARCMRRNAVGGTITASGIVATVGGNSFYSETGTVGPFTASHDALVRKEIPTELGMVLEDLVCVRKRGISDAIFEVRPVQGAASKRRAGVVSHRAPLAEALPAALIEDFDEDGKPIPVKYYAELCERYDLVKMNAVGEGQVLVSGANGNIHQGDLITSSGLPGIGMRQDGDTFKVYTIAQAREPILFDSPTDVRLVACYYHCG